MILYYSERSIYADIFVHALGFFLPHEVRLFSFEQSDINVISLLIIDGSELHPMRLDKILRQYRDVHNVIYLSDGVCHDRRVTVQLPLNVSAYQVSEVAKMLLTCDRPQNKNLFNSNEEQLFNGLIQGWSNRKIARGQGLALSTVKYNLQNIYAKLGVDNRTQAALKLRDIAL